MTTHLVSTSDHTSRAVGDVSALERAAMALALFAFALLFVAAQALHTNPFAGLEPMDGVAYLRAFHGHPLLHLGHLFEFVCGGLLIAIAAHFYGETRAAFPRLSFIALVMGSVGALMLVGNKAAICLSASAFDTLPEPQLQALVPGLDALINRQGLMVVLSLLPLLPLGFVLFGTLLWRKGELPRWQAALVFAGSLLLVNPGVQVLNTLGATLLALAFVPMAVTLFRQPS